MTSIYRSSKTDFFGFGQHGSHGVVDFFLALMLMGAIVKTWVLVFPRDMYGYMSSIHFHRDLPMIFGFLDFKPTANMSSIHVRRDLPFYVWISNMR